MPEGWPQLVSWLVVLAGSTGDGCLQGCTDATQPFTGEDEGSPPARAHFHIGVDV